MAYPKSPIGKLLDVILPTIEPTAKAVGITCADLLKKLAKEAENREGK